MDISVENSKNVIQQTQRIPKNQLSTEDFFQLLATQLKYQDPLSEENNSSEFINQMVQMNTMEQLQDLNKNFSQLTQYQNLQYASSLIGKNVSLNTGNQSLEGIVDKIKIIQGDAYIIVENVLYSLDQIVEIQEKDLR